MVVEPTQPEVRRNRHLEELKSQIARCLDQELGLKVEERRERARQLGIDLKSPRTICALRAVTPRADVALRADVHLRL